MKNRDWGSDSEDDKPAAIPLPNSTKIEAKHNPDNMKKYIKNNKTIEVLIKKGITYLSSLSKNTVSKPFKPAKI
jgi:hypothetical protein